MEPPSKTARRVLVIAGDRHHPAEPILAGLQAAAGSVFDFERFDDDFSRPAGDYATIVLARLNARAPKGANLWTDEGLEWFLDALSNCNGLLSLHAGTVGYAGPIKELVGGGFIQHPEPLDVKFSTVGTQDSFTIHDEHYFMDCQNNIDVFLESHSVHGVQPAGWRRVHQDKKFSVLTPGHFAEVWAAPAYQQMLLRELEWITESTLPKA